MCKARGVKALRRPAEGLKMALCRPSKGLEKAFLRGSVKGALKKTLKRP